MLALIYLLADSIVWPTLDEMAAGLGINGRG